MKPAQYYNKAEHAVALQICYLGSELQSHNEDTSHGQVSLHKLSTQNWEIKQQSNMLRAFDSEFALLLMHGADQWSLLMELPDYVKAPRRHEVKVPCGIGFRPTYSTSSFW